jgi:hypothetical protein
MAEPPKPIAGGGMISKDRANNSCTSAKANSIYTSDRPFYMGSGNMTNGNHYHYETQHHSNDSHHFTIINTCYAPLPANSHAHFDRGSGCSRCQCSCQSKRKFLLTFIETLAVILLALIMTLAVIFLTFFKTLAVTLHFLLHRKTIYAKRCLRRIL